MGGMDEQCKAGAQMEVQELEIRVPHLLGVAKNTHTAPHLRVEALDELSSVLVAGRLDSELSTAVVTAGW